MPTASSTNQTTCADFAATNGFSTAAIRSLNPDIWCPDIGGYKLCAPLRCKVQTITAEIPARDLAVAGSLKDSTGSVISEVQFWKWNTFLNHADLVFEGDAVCVSYGFHLPRVSGLI